MPEPPAFDPFSRRADRDIRNRLSSAFAESMETGRPVFRDACRELAPLAGGAAARFLKERLSRYEKVWPLVRPMRSGGDENAFRLLWNHGLFFECHEILEDRWQTARGNARAVIQGLIQAAGVYVHLELERKRPAQKLAARAVARLRAHREDLEPWADPDALLKALEALEPAPPVLSEPSRRRR